MMRFLPCIFAVSVASAACTADITPSRVGDSGPIVDGALVDAADGAEPSDAEVDGGEDAAATDARDRKSVV